MPAADEMKIKLLATAPLRLINYSLEFQSLKLISYEGSQIIKVSAVPEIRLNKVLNIL